MLLAPCEEEREVSWPWSCEVSSGFCESEGNGDVEVICGVLVLGMFSVRSSMKGSRLAG